jgi:hypothetical protein
MKGPQKWSHAQRGRLFEEIPCGIVVIDRALKVVDSTTPSRRFGGAAASASRRSAGGRAVPGCPPRRPSPTPPRVREQTGQDVTVAPVTTSCRSPDRGIWEVEFVVATAADLSATKRLQRE